MASELRLVLNEIVCFQETDESLIKNQVRIYEHTGQQNKNSALCFECRTPSAVREYVRERGSERERDHAFLSIHW